MSSHHEEWTRHRLEVYGELFGSTPLALFPAAAFIGATSSPQIDVVVYPVAVEGESDICVAVTNGMSDRPMQREQPDSLPRRELLQYFRGMVPKEWAQRLYEAAWLPHFEGFLVEELSTISWPDAPAGALKNSLLIRPIWQPHAEFAMEIEGEEAAFLWHVPLTDAELALKKTQGFDALVDRMDAVPLPWAFDPNTRPALV